MGLDAAGKTTIMYMLHLGERITTVPTMGFNVETIQLGRARTVVMWDCGGGDKIRPLLHHHMPNVECVVWVVDSCDHERLEMSRDELWCVLCEETNQHALLLVYANKQDLPGAMSVAEVTQGLGLLRSGGTDDNDDGFAERLHVQPCSAFTGEGLYPGIAWYLTQAAKQHATHYQSWGPNPWGSPRAGTGLVDQPWKNFGLQR